MPLTIDEMIDYITRGHAWDKHALGNDPNGGIMTGHNAFRDQIGGAAGKDLHIDKPEDLADFMRRMVDDPDTKGLVAKNGKIEMYNSRTNVYMRFDPKSQDMGTVFRYPESAENFKHIGRELGSSGNLASRFDNATSPGAARSALESLGRRMNRPPLNPPNTRVSPGYQAEMRTMDNFNAMRTPLDRGQGFVAELDARGRPSHMVFMDDAAGTVTEIKNGDVIVRNFDNLPESMRAGAAQQFFNAQRDAAIAADKGFTEVSEGGFDALKKAFTTQNPGKGVPFSSTSRVLDSVDSVPSNTAGKTFTSQNGFSSVDDMVQQFVGFSDDQMRMYNNVTSMTDDEFVRLSSTLDPDDLENLKALRTSAEYTSLSHAEGLTDDAIEGLVDFSKTMDKIDTASKTRLLSSLDSVVDAAKTADAASDLARGAKGLSSLVDIVRGIKIAKPTLNVGKSGIITTVAFTAASVAMTTTANAMMRNIADKLHEQDPENFTAEMRDKYQEMMDDVGTVLEVQAADPGPWAIFTMAGAESYAYDRFKEYSDEVGLSDEMHQLLAPSIVAGTSLRGEIGTDTYKIIPDTVTSSNDPLRDLIEARNAVEQAKDDYNQTYSDNQPPLWQRALLDSGASSASGGMMMMEPPSVTITKAAPAVQEAQTQVDQAQRAFQAEFDKVLSDPVKARALTEVMDKDDLLEIVERTAKFNNEDAHPMIKAYVEAQAADAAWYDLKGAWDNSTARDETAQALLDNPEVMRDYVSNLFTPKTTEIAPAPLEMQNGTEQGYVPTGVSPENEQDINFTPAAGYSSYAEGLADIEHPGLIIDTSGVSDAQGAGIYDGYTTDAINLPETTSEDYSNLFTPLPDHIDSGIYYNLTDLPPLQIPEYEFDTPAVCLPEDSANTDAPNLIQSELMNDGQRSHQTTLISP